MGRKVQIAVVLAVIGLIGLAGGAYAWDSSRSDEIAEGVEIGGVDVGGMTEAKAERRVTRELVKPLDKPLVVTYEDVRYQLHQKRLQIAADIQGTVDRALEVSQEDGLPSRIWRYATGGEVEESISPRVTYDEAAVSEFVEKIAAAVNREPVDASIEASATSVDPVASQAGQTLREDELRDALTVAVQSANHRTVEAGVDKVQPEVTTQELADEYPIYLTVSRSSFQLKLWEDLELAKTYTVAIGAVGYETPAGLYSIQNKAVDPAWNVPDSDWAGKLAGKVIPGGAPNNPLKARWLGFYDGAGIHGTDDVGSLGTAASHGCVRMAIGDVIELYDQVPLGTPIYIG